MCLFQNPKAPPPVAIPNAIPPPAPAPDTGAAAVSTAQNAMKQRRMAASGANATLINGGAGLIPPAQTAGKQLYGQ